MGPPIVPTTMRAAAWTSTSGGLEKNLKYETELKLPKSAQNLPKDSVLVNVAYSSLNPVDYKAAELPAILSRFVYTKPAVPCGDFAGHVVQSNVSEFKPGDAVFGLNAPPVFGALGEYLVASKAGTVALPDKVSLKDASTLGIAGLTAWQCLVPFVKSGGKVLINGGSGGTGTFGIQIAKAIGCEVTTTCSGANVELCKSLGADHVIDYRTNDVVSTLKSNGVQFDLIVDNVFTDDLKLYLNSHHYLKPGCTYVNIGVPVSFSWITNLMRAHLLPSFLGGGRRKFKVVAVKANAEQYAALAAMMAEGKVTPLIEKEYDLQAAGEAFAHLKTGRTKGKLVIKVSE